MIINSCTSIQTWYGRQRPRAATKRYHTHTSFSLRTAASLFLLSLTSVAEVRADDPWRLSVTEQELKEIADGALTITSFFGPQRGALGFDHLASVGGGFEIETSAYSDIISRTRLVGRYVFGDNVSGFSIGLAVSF